MSRQYQVLTDEVSNFQRLINAQIAQINTCMPARIVSIDGDLATIQPLITLFYRDQQNNIQKSIITEIPNIPLLYPGTAATSIKFQVSVGDTGIYLINQADVDPIYRSGSPTHRRFDLLDGVFIPMLMGNSGSGMEITSTGEINITAPTVKIDVTDGFSVTNEAGSVIPAVITALTAIMNLVTLSSDVLNPATQAAIAAQIAILQSFEA